MAQVARIKIEGMTCSACSSSVENVLQGLHGVTHAAVSLTLSEAEVEYNSGELELGQILEAIEDAGFEAQIIGHVDRSAVTISIKGMTCSSCASSVEKAIKQVRISRLACLACSTFLSAAYAGSWHYFGICKSSTGESGGSL